MATIASLSETIADFVGQFSLKDVPEEIIEKASLLLVDAFGTAIAAYGLKHVRSVRLAAARLAGGTDSTLWGTGQKVGVAGAALANASLIHGLDYDDTHVAAIVHPSAAVVSTALAVGEAVRASGRDVLGAIICGWEIMIRLGLAAEGKLHDHGFHATGIAAPFASACVAAKLRGHSKAVLVHALGICGSQAAGLQQFLHDGSWIKKLHPGWGAHSGIYALTLAEEGFTGPLRVFEGKYGLYRSHLGAANDIKAVFADLGTRWRTGEISVKLYPCCHFTHSFIECALELQREHQFTAGQIARIECRTIQRFANVVCLPEALKKRPRTDNDMRFSLAYVVASAILKGKVGPQEIDASHADDPELLQLMDKVACLVDETVDNPGHFPGWMSITLNDGTAYQRIQPFERGSDENPIDRADIIGKFYNNAGIHFSRKRSDELLDKLLHFGELKSLEQLISIMEERHQ